MDKADEGKWIHTAGFQLYAELTLRKKGYVYKQLGAQPPPHFQRKDCALSLWSEKATGFTSTAGSHPTVCDSFFSYCLYFLLSWLFSTVESTLSRQWTRTYRGLANHFRSVSSLASRDGFYWSCITHTELWPGEQKPENNLFG